LIEDLDGKTERIIDQRSALDKADLDFASTAFFYMRLCLLCIVYNAENANYVALYTIPYTASDLRLEYRLFMRPAVR